MEKLVLQVEKRDSNESVAELRAAKIIPWIVYGKNQETISIKVDNSSLLRAFRVVGKKEVFTLELEGKKIDVIIKENQNHPVTGDFLHIDYYAA